MSWIIWTIFRSARIVMNNSLFIKTFFWFRMESGYKIPTRDNLHPIFDIKISRTYVHSFNVHLITCSWSPRSSSKRKLGFFIFSRNRTLLTGVMNASPVSHPRQSGHQACGDMKHSAITVFRFLVVSIQFWIYSRFNIKFRSQLTALIFMHFQAKKSFKLNNSYRNRS